MFHKTLYKTLAAFVFLVGTTGVIAADSLPPSGQILTLSAFSDVEGESSTTLFVLGCTVDGNPPFNMCTFTKVTAHLDDRPLRMIARFSPSAMTDRPEVAQVMIIKRAEDAAFSSVNTVDIRTEDGKFDTTVRLTGKETRIIRVSHDGGQTFGPVEAL